MFVSWETRLEKTHDCSSTQSSRGYSQDSAAIQDDVVRDAEVEEDALGHTAWGPVDDMPEPRVVRVGRGQRAIVVLQVDSGTWNSLDLGGAHVVLDHTLPDCTSALHRKALEPPVRLLLRSALFGGGEGCGLDAWDHTKPGVERGSGSVEVRRHLNRGPEDAVVGVERDPLVKPHGLPADACEVGIEA